MKEDTIEKIDTLRKQGLSVGQIYEKLKPTTRGLKESQVHYHVYKKSVKDNAPQKTPRAAGPSKSKSNGMVAKTETTAAILKAVGQISSFDGIAEETRLSLIKGLVK